MSLFGSNDGHVMRNYFNQINNKLDKIIMKQSELAANLEGVSSQLSKAKDEILAELDKLRASDPDLSPEGIAAVQKLGNIAQALDDVIADAPPPVEPPVEPEPVEPPPVEPA